MSERFKKSFTLPDMMPHSGISNNEKKLGMSTLCAHFEVLP